MESIEFEYEKDFFIKYKKTEKKLSNYKEQIEGFFRDGLSITKQHSILEKNEDFNISYEHYRYLIKEEFYELYVSLVYKNIFFGVRFLLKKYLDNGISSDEIYNLLEKESKLQIKGRGLKLPKDRFLKLVNLYQQDIHSLEQTKNKIVVKKDNVAEDKAIYSKKVSLKENFTDNKISKMVEPTINTVMTKYTTEIKYIYDDVDDDVLEDKFDMRFKYVVFEDLSTKRMENILSKFYISPDKPDVVTEKRFFYIGPEYYKDDILNELLGLNIFKDFDLFAVTRKNNGRMENDVIYFRLFQGEFIQLKKTQKVFENDVRIMLTRGKRNYFKVLKKYADKIPENSREIYLPTRYTS
jgi:hypothetical protein